MAMKKQSRRKVVLTGGKFNRLHPGHEYLLKKCKSLGYLVVVLAHDRHNKKPYAISVKQRRRNLEKLKIADKIVIGSPNSFVGVVNRFKPDIIVLGYDQELPDEETKKAVKKTGIKVVRCKRFGKY